MRTEGLTRSIVVVLLVAVILAAIGVGSAAVSRSRFQLASTEFEPIACVPDEETKEKIRNILLEATTEALKNHVVRMHEIWMRDDTNQPKRATNGVRQGIRAFISGHTFVKQWNPPLCPSAGR
jgi:hypothetical protein